MIRISLVAVLAALSLTANPIDQATKVDDKQLSQMAQQARTAAEHNRVAALYEKRAEAMEAKAKEHEAEATRLENRQGYNPMAHKWPALAKGPVEHQRSKAMQARRAAREALELAARHRELAAKANA